MTSSSLGTQGNGFNSVDSRVHAPAPRQIVGNGCT
eukprot:CAMPEP_0184681610 /NCGR_PEP_ID=MMETSP0312-20130426/4600_1 /TAXON_ID=31354 /ORGANISM="Compsopogon coeruleus, Strain SAG 36.94" /LENGTH=34 /DNA_ID= /DNA_START= /DNA_END= /DNA_ORIENTATION=